MIRFRAECNNRDDYFMFDDITVEFCNEETINDDLRSRKHIERHVDTSDFKIYPNPTNNDVHIDIDEDPNLEIFDLQGKLLKQSKLLKGHNTADLSGLYGGQIYLFRIITVSGVIKTEMVIKE